MSPHAADKSDRPGFGPAYHWRNGWTFQRCVDEKFGEIGEVLITNADAFRNGEISMLIPAAEWASIVAHVSAASEIRGITAYAVAEALHAGHGFTFGSGEPAETEAAG